jgi:hypothetical protein
MTEDIAIELLQNVVNICGAGNTFEGQVEALVGYGFTKEDLMYFGFSEEDLDKCGVDIYSREDEVSRVTLWYTLEEDDFNLYYNSLHYEYNHLEDGWQNGAAPKPISKLQERAWAKKSWRKKHCRLINGKVVE